MQIANHFSRWKKYKYYHSLLDLLTVLRIFLVYSFN